MDANVDCLNALYGSKAGYILSNVAEVVERVLMFVPTKSLLRSACVCRLWRNCARRVLRTRQQMTWVSAAGPSSGDGHALCKTLSDEVEKIYTMPQTILIMVDSETISGQESNYRHKKARTASNSDTAESLRRLFPKGCEILGISTPGVVLTPSYSSSARPVEYQTGEAGFSLMFPNIDGVTIRPFHFCKHSFTKTSMEEAGLVNNPDLRIVLLFAYQAFRAGGSSFLNQLLNRLARHGCVLVAGGHVEGIFCESRECCRRGGYGVAGLALSGSRVQGASVLLEQDVSDEKTVEATMQRLKLAGLPERNTLGFMFACLGRGPSYYMGQHNVEADAFRKIFPNTPLFGFFGNGEIGCDHIVTESFTVTDTDNLQHGYTTVMSLVHLG